MTALLRRAGAAVATVLTALAAILPAATLGASRYMATDLGVAPGYQSNRTVQINDAGSAVGFSERFDANGVFIGSAATVWPAGGAMQTLLPAAGYDFVHVGGINATGAVAFSSSRSLGTGREGNDAFVWSPSGSRRSLDVLPGASLTITRGINDAGQVVGSTSDGTPAADTQAVMWDGQGRVTPLPPTPLGPETVATAIDNSGRVLTVGISADGTRAGGFWWNPGSGYTPLANLPGYANTWADGLNQLGEAVGIGYTDGSAYRAVLWDRFGQVLDLGSLAGRPVTMALAINDAGAVVGQSFAANAGDQQSFLWTATDGMLDLQSLIDPGQVQALQLSQIAANDINASGQIIASALIGGTRHGLLLTPVPEPSTTVLLLAGGLALMAWRARLGKPANRPSAARQTA